MAATQTSRRTLLKSGLAAGTLAVPGVAGLARPVAAVPARADPFTLGVASGDPSPDGFVLWTRLAVEPLAEDGLGGMPNRPVTIRWEVAGPEQEQWLLDGFRRSTARWDVLGQQVFFAQRDADAGPLKRVSMDTWDGYAASRQRITQGWVDAGVRNPVVLTGDVHAHWASDLKVDYDDPTSLAPRSRSSTVSPD